MTRTSSWIRLTRAAALAVAVTVSLGVAPRVASADVKEELEDGDRAFEAEDWKRAAKDYDRAIKRWPAQVPPEAYAKRAAIFLFVRDYQSGLDFIIQKAEVQHPGAPEILEQKALILWAMKQRADAVTVAEEVSQKMPSAYAVQVILGEFYYGREPAKAKAALERYFQHRPSELERNDLRHRLRLGISYLQITPAAPDKAAEQFEAVLRNYKDNPIAERNANNGLCAAYSGSRDWNRAITVCERIVADQRQIDPAGSVYYNLGRAYLGNRQADKALFVGRQFITMHPAKSKGYLLVGDAFLAKRDYQSALQQYINAEQRDRGAPGLSAKLGETRLAMYREGLPGGDNLLVKAIEDLNAAVGKNPDDVHLRSLLAEAHIENKQDGQALSIITPYIKQDGPPAEQARLRYLAGRAHYNQNQLDEARQQLVTAHSLDRNETKIKTALVLTINRQAYQAYRDDKNRVRTEKLLDEALGYDDKSDLTHQNLAVIALSDNDCSKASRHVKELLASKRRPMVANRLAARLAMCGSKPNKDRAAEFYAAAEKEAVKAGNNLVRAEVYTEWAPLIADKSPQEAIDKLEKAVQFAAREPAIIDAAKRNLALALFRRGWANMREGKAAEAVSDFEQSTREPRLLKGTEQAAFEFSLALAYLERGDTANALKLFRALAQKGGQDKYLKAPYNKVGSEFFAAYAEYRTSSLKSRRSAADEFSQLQRNAKGPFAVKLRDLVASSWEYIAYEEFKANSEGAAAKSLARAEQLAVNAGSKRVIEHNRAVLLMDKNPKAAEDTFERLGAEPPEALVNLGILQDRAGRPKDAYETWLKAKRTRARSARLDKWIDAKKRIFGF